MVKLLGFLVTLVVCVSVGTLALGIGLGSAQTPSPAGTPAASACPRDVQATTGGQELVLGRIRLTLPAGGIYVMFYTPPSPHTGVIVCYVEGASSITISVLDCTEISRNQREAGAVNVFNALLRSCVLSADEEVGGGRPTFVTPPDTPGLSATPDTRRCRPALPATAGQRIRFENIALTLPATGTFAVFESPPNPIGRTLIVCYLEGDVGVSLFGPDCRELYRDRGTVAAEQVLDAIVRSCIVVGATPFPPPPVIEISLTPPAILRIRPPDTGDAGLVSQP